MRISLLPGAATVSALLLVMVEGSAADRSPQTPADRRVGPVAIDFRAVTDDGQFVLDVTREEVVLKVNGRARAIHSLELIRLGGGPASAEGAPASPLPPPFATNAWSDAGRDVLLVVDEDSIAPGGEQPVRDVAGQLLAGLSARDRVGLLTVPRGGTNVGLTNQHGRIRSALAGMTSRAQSGETASDVACRTRLTLQALEDVFDATSSESPTTIVFFSVGLAPPSADQAQMNSASGFCEVRPEHFRDLATVALASRVNFYVVHVIDGTASGRSTGSVNLAAGLESLAGVTGGELVRMLGNSRGAFTRVARETSAYYLVTFEPEASEQNGSSHRVDLRVGRAGVKVRARPEVTIPKADGRTARANAPTSRDMLRAGKTSRDLPLRAASYVARNPGDDKVKVVALFEPLDPSVVLTSAVVGLFDERGRLTAQWTARAADLARAPVMSALVAPAGRYRLRVAATDASGRGGTVDDEIRAEIARADPLMLSALVLGTSQDGSFAPKLQFGAESAAVGYVEIYGVAKTASVSASLELAATSDGQALVTVPATIAPATGGDLLIAYGAIPIAELPPGDHLVRAIVNLDGKAVGRVVRTLRKAGPAS